uniref:C2H2-type domain-containing protein n=1 Tax=Timema poppense TaxID=170557 RepID=A0A7R9DNA0_TIMPO|nr:unnamed protein product [Timema poppensis]
MARTQSIHLLSTLRLIQKSPQHKGTRLPRTCYSAVCARDEEQGTDCECDIRGAVSKEQIIPVMNVETIERSSTKRHTYPRKAKLNIKVTPMRHSRGTRSSSVSSTDSQNSEEDDQRTAAEDIEFIPSRFRIRKKRMQTRKALQSAQLNKYCPKFQYGKQQQKMRKKVDLNVVLNKDNVFDSCRPETSSENVYQLKDDSNHLYSLKVDVSNNLVRENQYVTSQSSSSDFVGNCTRSKQTSKGRETLPHIGRYYESDKAYPRENNNNSNKIDTSQTNNTNSHNKDETNYSEEENISIRDSNEAGVLCIDAYETTAEMITITDLLPNFNLSSLNQEQINCTSTKQTTQNKIKGKLFEGLRKGAMSNSEDISENTSNYEIFTGCLNTYPDSEHSISKQNINYNELDLIFMCSKCPKKFANRIDLVHHSSTHNVQRGYQCSICDEWYSNKNNLVKHLSVHTKDRPYRCDLCGTTFSRMSYLTKHMNTHTHSKSYICNKCGHSCSHRERITLHVRRHMNNPYDIQQHECPLCDKAFCHPSGLSRHLLSHTGKTYDCVYCNKKFSDHSTLKRHGIKHSQT